MSGRSISSRRDSASESESEISIAPSSINGLRRSKPRHVIYEDSEVDDGDSRHSELDISLYDTDEIQDSERPSYRISLGSDGLGSIPFVSIVTTAPHLRRGPPLHLQQLQQQNQQLENLQRQQHEQIQEQQQRFPDAYEAASISATSFYKYLRDTFGAFGGETDSSRSAAFNLNASYMRSSRAPAGPEANVRTKLSSTSSRDAPLGTPNDSYDVLGTPPGEPPALRPSRTRSEQSRDSNPFDDIHSQALQHLPRSMNSFLLALLMAAGFGIGFAALSADPPEAYGYWLNHIGTLYVRLVNCAAVPMGICQVIFSVSTLTARGALWRLWLKTLGFYLVLCLLSVMVAIIIAGALRHSLKQTDELLFEASSTRFGFQCSNSKYLELNGTSLSCDSDTFDDANSSAAVFPSFVDVNAALGLPETITKLSLTQYLYLLGERYVPNNAVQALSADYYISSMVIATVLGVAVTRSFRGGGVGRDHGDATRNPLLRLFVHMYAALFTILDWLQSLALVAILPLTIGSVLIDPANAKLAAFAGKWCLTNLLVCAIQSLVLCPILFYLSPLLPLAVATKSVLRSREVPPAVFGALFPVLAACNRLAQAIVLPVVLMWVVSYTDCGLSLDFSNSALLFGYSVVASLGDTAVPQASVVFFFTVWRSFCGSSDLPALPIELGGVMLLITRLQAFTNTATNLMLVRMAASTDEGRMYAHHFAM
ncbi:hypothetical protein PR001_g26232 [Phytophthora rubi]|uniref:Amino acid transporter n=1 Tax=Phytophthora rubi TaxID=129364 RepID=A0A6A3HSU2_9STRA|nr:hypothetical protein PR001_g26232 [Phytophthora rubi]